MNCDQATTGAHLKNSLPEFPLWFSRLGTGHGVHENAGLIPGLIQWVKGSSVAVSCGMRRKLGVAVAVV